MRRKTCHIRCVVCDVFLWYVMWYVPYRVMHDVWHVSYANYEII